MSTTNRWIAFFAGILGFCGVALGAFGAHALKDALVARASLETWHTAVLYQIVHSVALLVIAQRSDLGRTLAWIGRLWVAGIILFSGSLYWLSLGGPKLLGPVTPLGGLAFLSGWLLVAWNALQSRKA